MTKDNVIRTAYDALMAKSSVFQAGYRPVVEKGIRAVPHANGATRAELPSYYHRLLELVLETRRGVGSLHHHLDGKAKQQSPLVNAGYAARLVCVTSSIRSFVEASASSPFKDCQLIFLGCGLDVAGIWAKSLVNASTMHISIIEVDQEAICREKVLSFSSLIDFDVPEPSDGQWFGRVQSGERGAKSSKQRLDYALISCDLRDVESLENALFGGETTDRSGCCLPLSPVPTLIVTELVLAYLGKSNVDRLLQFCSGRICEAHPHSAMVMLEPVGPTEPPTEPEGVVEAHRREYCQRFVEKLSRGIAKPVFEELFSPLGESFQGVEDRLQFQCGFGWVKASSIGTVAASEIRMNAVEPFDEHAALTLHLLSYTLAIAFPTSVPSSLIRAMCCRWSNVSHDPMDCFHSFAKSDVTIHEILAKEEDAVRWHFEETYRELSMNNASLRKMMKVAMVGDMARRPGDMNSTIAKNFVMAGGCFIVASTADTPVAGFLAVRRQPYHKKSTDGPSYELHRLAVLPSCRGKGIARTLLKAILVFVKNEMRMKRFGTRFRLVATTLNILESANKFYSACGFDLVESRQGSDLVFMTFERNESLDDEEADIPIRLGSDLGCSFETHVGLI